ncbi:TIR domain-containing protein [Rhodopseudomonas palustris]|nr:TIR domain-containing protein [Rhodopseudomonas palustris]
MTSLAGDIDREFDVALSFAGEDRSMAQKLAEMLKRNDVTVFYDEFYRAQLWGKDLYQHLQEIYREKSRYCVVFVSEAYLLKLWTKHELKQAQARAFEESREYVLPIRLDDSVLPGLNSTVGYVDMRATSVEDIACLLLEKLGRSAYSTEVDRKKWEGDFTEYNGRKVASFWPKQIERSQHEPFYLGTRAYGRIRHGEEKMWGRRKLTPRHVCHDCAALPGQFHVPGCDMEECPNCRGQAISCGCIHEAATADRVEAWEEGED